MTLIVDVEDLFEEAAGTLPESWAKIPLGDVCSVLNGFAFKSAYFNKKSNGVPVIRIRDLGKESSSTYYSGEFEPQYIVTSGDLLVGMDGTFRCRKWLGGKSLLNQRVCKLSPDEAFLEKTWLQYGLDRALRVIQGATSSMTVQHLSSRDIQRIPFPIPPRAEQRRIVGKLHEILGSLETCQARLARIPLMVRRFRLAVLAAACSGRLSQDWRNKRNGATEKNVDPDELPASWERVEFETLCTDITVGHVGPTAKEYVPAGIPFLRSMNVRRFKFDPKGLKFISREFHRRLAKCRLSPGDVVIVRSGNAGMACVIPPSIQEANCADLIVVRPGPKLNPHYACIAINSSEMQSHINQVKVGIAQAHFNIGEMRKAPLALPPIPEQKEIVRRVDLMFKLADQIEVRHAALKVTIGQLSQAVLAKAFRGELLPQDPKDESADKLLSRLRIKSDQSKSTRRVAANT